MRRAGTLALFTSLMLGSGSCNADAEGPPAPKGDNAATATFLTESKEITVALRIADEPQQIQRGLMFVEALPPFEGMIFIMPAMGVHSFWMKNTLIHLDMIFIDEERRIVGIVENAEPLTLTPRTVNRPSRYVIEVNGGFAKKHGLHSGDRVSLQGLKDRAP